MTELHLIQGGLFSDERGTLRFVNDFTFPGVCRFYITENADTTSIRAWQAHREEAKYFMAIAGKIDVAVVKVDKWEEPDPSTPVEHFLLDADTPSVLVIPPGYANGFRSITCGARLQVFSVSSLQQAERISFPPETWPFA